VLGNRVKLATVGTAAFAVLCGFVLMCCARPHPPAGGTGVSSVTTAPPRTADADGTAETVKPLPAPPEDAGTDQSRIMPPGDEPARPTTSIIEMEQAEEVKPELPPYLEIVEEIDRAQHASIAATLTPPRKLELDTQNVKLLRLTREGLPLTRNRSTVLQIDGQGIEWTPRYVAVELERSPAGEWTVIRRRPYQP
jgi:hypothetical protein